MSTQNYKHACTSNYLQMHAAIIFEVQSKKGSISSLVGLYRQENWICFRAMNYIQVNVVIKISIKSKEP